MYNAGTTPMNDSRFPRNMNPSHNGNRNQAAMNSNSNVNSRNMGQMSASRNISKNPGAERSRNNDQQSKGLSSAEFQRLQFEREREEIQLKRQNAKQLSGGVTNSTSDASSLGRIPAYHDECDLLMDELAGKNNISANIKNIVPVQKAIVPEQPTGNRTLLLAAIGLGVDDRSPQPSPQGMKKLNLDSIFTKKTTKLAPPPGITMKHGMSPTIGMGSLNGSRIFSADPVPVQRENFEAEINFTKEGSIADADDDYEVSMRMIDRMISGDDDYDKDDISTSYSEACLLQPSSRYTFSDSHASTINQFGIQQSLGMSLSPLPSTSRSSPLCIGGDNAGMGSYSLSSLKIQGDSSEGIASMLQPPYQSGYCSPAQTSQPTNVLLKLGYDAQSPSRNTDKIADEAALRMSSPVPANNTQKQSNVPSTPKQQTTGTSHASPFAFHSSSSGCGSSGGGSRRTPGGSSSNPVPSTYTSPAPTTATASTSTSSAGSDKGRVSLIKSNMSASSWQQLQKMARVAGTTPTTPRPEENTPAKPPTRTILDDANTAKQSTLNTTNHIQKAVTGTVFIGKDVGLHRINVSDLFKASSSVDVKSKKIAATSESSTR